MSTGEIRHGLDTVTDETGHELDTNEHDTSEHDMSKLSMSWARANCVRTSRVPTSIEESNYAIKNV